MCHVSACATANNAIGEAWRIIKFGDADAFLAGGSEASVVSLGISGFDAMKALSNRNDDPERASRPFDRDRDGLFSARARACWSWRNSNTRRSAARGFTANWSGYGLSADAYHMTSPSAGRLGARRAAWRWRSSTPA